MTNEVKKLVDAYVEKQISSYKKTNNFDRCFHRFQGYVECLVDMGMITTRSERNDVIDYMADKLEDSKC